ncbi:YraN family protein [uncultured Pontibacter sp.]|uniref:YraN family protein n=1 Tax=uncultured Pontibacter sp. TaxID=453356 RepID=UPI00263203F2|nr:YraN family protein [uncultured Pontibacter sp.]
MASQTNAHIRTGQNGEQTAAAYLIELGYTILQRNYRHKRAEIDIIAQQDDVLVFVEVKTRTSATFGYPEMAVSTKKEVQLLAAAEEYIYQTGWEKEIRFDIIAITLSPQLEVHHIMDAFH